jgi:imidazolonepropionase-like amidohydrolase
VNGARAIGLQGKAGEIAPNSFADLIAIPFVGKIEDAESAVIHHIGGVQHSIIDGKWAL